MRIALVSDAWAPQVNGVVRTLNALAGELARLGHEVASITPDLFRSIPCPTYPDIRLALGPRPGVARLVDEMAPDAIHIATEGPLGMAARDVCLRRGLAFTTAYHTRFPEYLSARLRVPLRLSYAALRRFHAPSRAVMVATGTIEQDLAARGFRNLRRWTRGVDAGRFRPVADKGFLDLKRPIFLTVARVAVEKNLPAFLDLDLPGSKLVVGDGPLLPELRRRYPQVHFAGLREGEELTAHYAASDVFVFPSRTDTFGLVLVEALASGLPVAAYPVPGPLDVVGGSDAGVLSEDLRAAALAALAIPPERARDHALRFSWAESARQFLANLAPARDAIATPEAVPAHAGC
jgi:glycosyltransferase involved in cell wall biosynthesis